MDYSDAPDLGAQATASLTIENDRAAGLAPVQWSDGRFSRASVAERIAIRAKGNYLYFQIDDAFAHDLPADSDDRYEVRAVLLDENPGRIDLQYDAHPQAGNRGDGRWTAAKAARLAGTGEWKTLRFQLPEPRFAGRQNGRADFRLRRHGRATLVCTGSISRGNRARRLPNPPGAST